MSFTIEICSELTPAQRTEIKALQSSVYEAEGLQNTVWLSNEIHFDRSIPCFFLGYENDRLASFLTLFLPSREKGEVTAFTAIQYRNKGYFTLLLEEARTILRENGVPDFLFALEPKKLAGMSYLYHHFPKAELNHTEWRMAREPDFAPLPVGVTVEPVTDKNLEEYVAISLHEYGGDREAVLAVIRSEIRSAYLMRDGDKPVAVFEIAHGDSPMLCGVVVAEAERGHGYGKAVVRAALNAVSGIGKCLELDVDSVNPPALHLYRKFGFRPTFEVQYWRVPIA